MTYFKLIGNNSLKSIYLIKAEDQSKPVWYYLELQKLQIPIFPIIIRDQRNKTSLGKYYRIIASGWGNNPHKVVKIKMI